MLAMKNENKTPSVWVVSEESWGSICGIYSTKELAEVALSVCNSESNVRHSISEEPLLGEVLDFDV